MSKKTGGSPSYDEAQGADYFDSATGQHYYLGTVLGSFMPTGVLAFRYETDEQGNQRMVTLDEDLARLKDAPNE